MRIEHIKPVREEIAKNYFRSKKINITFPVIICDILMILDRKGKIYNKEVFRAILNGYKIDIKNTQTPASENDDDLMEN